MNSKTITLSSTATEDEVNDYIDKFCDALDRAVMLFSKLSAVQVDAATPGIVINSKTHYNDEEQVEASRPSMYRGALKRSFVREFKANAKMLAMFGGFESNLNTDKQYGIGAGAIINLTETIAAACSMAVPGVGWLLSLVESIGFSYLNDQIFSEKGNPLENMLRELGEMERYNYLKNIYEGMDISCRQLINEYTSVLADDICDSQVQEDLRTKFRNCTDHFFTHAGFFINGDVCGRELGLWAKYCRLTLSLYELVIEGRQYFGTKKILQKQFISEYESVFEMTRSSILSMYTKADNSGSVDYNYMTEMMEYGYVSYLAYLIEHCISHEKSHMGIEGKAIKEAEDIRCKIEMPNTMIFNVGFDNKILKKTRFLDQFNRSRKGRMKRLEMTINHSTYSNPLDVIRYCFLKEKIDEMSTSSIHITYEDPDFEVGSITEKAGVLQVLRCDAINKPIEKISIREMSDGVTPLTSLSRHVVILQVATRKRNLQGEFVDKDNKITLDESELVYEPLLVTNSYSDGIYEVAKKVGVRLDNIDDKLLSILHLQDNRNYDFKCKFNNVINGIFFNEKEKEAYGLSVVPKVALSPYLKIRRENSGAIYLDGAVGLNFSSDEVGVQGELLQACTSTIIPKNCFAEYYVGWDDRGLTERNTSCAYEMLLLYSDNGNEFTDLKIRVSGSSMGEAPTRKNQALKLPGIQEDNKIIRGDYDFVDYFSYCIQQCDKNKVIGNFRYVKLDSSINLSRGSNFINIQSGTGVTIARIILFPKYKLNEPGGKLIRYGVMEDTREGVLRIGSVRGEIKIQISDIIKKPLVLGSYDCRFIEPQINFLDEAFSRKSLLSKSGGCNYICDASVCLSLAESGLTYRLFFAQGLVYIYSALSSVPDVIYISELWPELAQYGFSNSIDAICNADPSDSSFFYIFKGDSYIRARWNEYGTGITPNFGSLSLVEGPQKVKDGWSCLSTAEVDTVVLIGYNPPDNGAPEGRAIFLFVSGNTYSVVGRPLAVNGCKDKLIIDSKLIDSPKIIGGSYGY
ncbi:hypothetical protein JEV30_24885 [Pseudomonas aeruginosa]|nr:hypothetical protein [Pseudomonas aeruginosa]